MTVPSIPIGQNAQASIPQPTVPATVPANGNITLGPMIAAGFHGLAAACTLSVAGSISIQRYIDLAGTIAIGNSVSQAITGGTPATVAIYDDQPAASWIVTIANSTGGVGNLTNTAFLATI